MKNEAEKMKLQALMQQIEEQLLDQYGHLIGGKDLYRALGYKTGDAFRQAVSKGTLPITTFLVTNRRGRFALSCDIAKWIAEQRFQK